MEKLDLRKTLKHLYAPSAKQIQLVNVPQFNFAMLDGVIQPGQPPAESPEFQNALMALYGISFTLKFMSKLRKENPIDYSVMALEALWWVESGEFDLQRHEPWFYTALMLQPHHITMEMFYAAREELRKKRDNPALSELRFEPFHEGETIQIMHIGPYSQEYLTIEKMKTFASENGYRYHGKHHEIYLGDPRRAKPEKLKTILRQPVKRVP